MCSFYHFFLQYSSGTPEFVLRSGMLVFMLVIFLIVQTLLFRSKHNHLLLEKKLLQEQFDTQFMHQHIEVQQATFDRLGEELHDNVGQLLSTAKMFIGITERSMAAPPTTLLSANETLDKAITELRDLSKSFNRDWIEQFDLYHNLHEDIDRINSGGALHITLHRNSHLLPIDNNGQFFFYRLLQEGIQNVLKHADAKNVHLHISHDRHRVLGVLQDDGHGFVVKDRPTGLGITIMQQRIKLLRGTIEWDSGPGGTTLTILIPVKNPTHEI